ncbi:MAG: TolC family protein [Polaromonas sp.]|nr:TolC family protein [Polaromonas sp.]
MFSFHKSATALLAVATLAGCASLSPDGNQTDINTLTAGKTAGINAPVGRGDSAETREEVARLLAGPLSAESAVRIALLNNPGIHASMAALGISDADRVRAGTLPNPHFSIGRFVEGRKVEIERGIGFNVIGLLTLPWRARYQSQQHEVVKLQAAQEVVKLAADTRKAWITAVAAQQTASYMKDAKEAAEASGELARRLARVGNWSKLNQAREQAFVADAAAQLARSQNTAYAAREKLVRLMGLWGTQTQFTLSERLPDIPKTLAEMPDIEARALRDRLDVRASMAQAGYVADNMGLTRSTGFINALDAKYSRNTTFNNATGDKEIKRGWELELPLPIFDWGGASNARAQGQYMQSVARVRETAIQARSEARESYHAWRTAHDLAMHYRDEVVPLRKFINNELLLRYNGMLASVFDLLADTRTSIAAVNASIEAQRDFWLADTDLQTTLTGTSAGMAPLAAGVAAGGSEAKGH